MAGVVNLRDIVYEISIMSDVMKSFVDRETGKVIAVEIEELGVAEEGEEEDVAETALAIVKNWDRYEEMPGKRDVNDWEIMRDFCEAVEPPKRRDRLLRAIGGRGAFRYFKDLATEFGVIKDWYAFREDALREIAREWCEENEIEYKDIRRTLPE
jgi:guanyl-specific ribonuclease Sa